MSKWSQKSQLRPTRQIIRLSVIRSTRWVKTVTLAITSRRHNALTLDSPLTGKGTMPSWTEPTLDQLIIRFNASKSINYASPMWNKHIYLTPNSVETNTHVSALHSTIRKQLSKIGQSTEWHFNTQGPCMRPDTTQIFNPKVYQAHKPPMPSCASWHQQLSCWTWHSWPESSQYQWLGARLQ